MSIGLGHRSDAVVGIVCPLRPVPHGIRQAGLPAGGIKGNGCDAPRGADQRRRPVERVVLRGRGMSSASVTVIWLPLASKLYTVVWPRPSVTVVSSFVESYEYVVILRLGSVTLIRLPTPS